MKSELIVIESSRELEVLTSVRGVDDLIAQVQEQVNSLDGGTMNTSVGRKKIISNANKARKSKVAVSNAIDALIDAQKYLIESKTSGERKTIELLKESKARFGAGLDDIYKNTRQAVTDFENELKRVKAEKEAEEAAKALLIQIESDHEIGILLNEKFDRDLVDAKALAERQEQERIEEIKKQAVIDAELKAKQDIIDAKAEAERERKAAIQAELDAEQARFEAEELKRQVAIDAEKAEAARVEREQKYKEDQLKREEENRISRENAKILARKQAEQAAENARLKLIAEQQAEQAQIEADQAERLANRAHIGNIRKQAKESLMHFAGLTDEQAKTVVIAISKEQITHCSIKY